MRKSPFLTFFKNIRKYGFSYYKMYLGPFEGFVESNDDPEHAYRIKVRIPSVYGKKVFDKWIPCMSVPGGSAQGLFVLPQKGDMVYVQFKNGNAEFPIWTYGPRALKKGINTGVKDIVVQSVSGHKIELIDEADRVIISHKDGTEIVIENGKVKSNGDNQGVARGDDVQFVFDQIISAIEQAPVVPTDGGTSFKLALIVSLNILKASPQYKAMVSNKTYTG